MNESPREVIITNQSERLITDEVEFMLNELNTLAGNVEAPHTDFKLTPYEKEAEHCVEKWQRTGLLEKMNESFKPQCAVLLENQRLYNENHNDSGDVAQFKRVSIPLVRRICGGLKLHHFASVQPLLGPAGLVYYFKNNKIVDSDIAATVHKMKAIWSYEAQQDLRSQFNLDAEAELTAVLAQELTLEIDRMALTDMTNNAALKKEVDFEHLGGETINDKWAAVQEMVVDLATENHDLYHRPFPNWIVTSRDMAECLCPKNNDNEYYWMGLGIEPWGNLTTELGDVKVWYDPLFPKGKVLVGYKGDHPYDAGYIWAPYIMLGQTPVVLDPDSFVPRRGLLCRYGKKLADPTYYSTLYVKNFISQEQWDDMEAMKNGISRR